jgi:hypothetical protein
LIPIFLNNNTTPTSMIIYLTHGQCRVLMASMIRSIDLTGDNCGLRKRHKNRHWEKLGSDGSDTPDERCRQPLLSSSFIYTAYMMKQGKMQVKFSRVQSHRWQEQRNCGMLLFTTDYPYQVSVQVFLQGSLAEPCILLAGSMLSAKRPLT